MDEKEKPDTMDDEKDLSEDELSVWIHRQIQNSYQRSRAWRSDAREDYAFYASDQWSDEDKVRLMDTGRPAVVFNRIPRAINVVAGMEVQNRQEVRFVGRESQNPSDHAVAEAFSNVSKWVMDNCDGDDESSEMFQDALICGMGWTETRVDFDDDPEGRLVHERIDPLEMGWDHYAKKRNLEDANFVWRSKKLSRREFNSLWPGKTPGGWGFEFEMEAPQPGTDYLEKFYKFDQGGNQKGTERGITVVQFQWREKKKYYQVEIPHPATGQPMLVEQTEEQFKAACAIAQEQGRELKHVERARWVYREAFLSGKELLEQKELASQHGFTFRCMTGLRERNTNTWFSIVRLMKDPQRWGNRWLSQIMFILSTKPKGGAFYEEGAFVNPRKAEEDWAKPDALIKLNAGGLAKIQERKFGDYPTGLDRLLQYSLQAITDVPGINVEMLGLADRSQAGVLEAQRKQAGVTILAVFFDGFRRYRKKHGRILLEMIQKFLSEQRLLRILGEEFTQIIPAMKAVDVLTYDILVDDAPTSTNQKERIFSILSQIVPQMAQLGLPVPPEILDFLPLPESLIQKWKQMIQPDPQKAQMQQEQAAMAHAGKAAEIKHTEAKAELDRARAMKEGVSAAREGMEHDIESHIFGNPSLGDQ